MAYSVIKKSSDYFNTKLYTGNGTDNHAITGVGFQPDFVWLKSRSDVDYNYLQDAVRGATKQLVSNSAGAETSYTNGVKSFDSDGITLGTSNWSNENSQTRVIWNWKAGGTASSNTSGSITSSVSANTTSGFSIVSYTGTGSNATIGHGLGATPAMVMVKNASVEQNWRVWNKNLNSNQNIILNTDAAATVNTGQFNSSATFNSNVFSVGGENGTNGSGETIIAYCFADVQGYSKFGSYTGNGAGDGTFIYTGFKPAFVMVKNTDAARNWTILDNKRDVFNACSIRLFPNSSEVEAGNVGSEAMADILSNGFKTRTNDANFNASGNNYIYMAFAEQPLVGDNPATAR